MDKKSTLFYLFNNLESDDPQVFDLKKLLEEEDEMKVFLKKIKCSPRREVTENIMNFAKLVTTSNS